MTLSIPLCNNTLHVQAHEHVNNATLSHNLPQLKVRYRHWLLCLAS